MKRLRIVLALNRLEEIFLLPVGEKEGPAPQAREDEGDQVMQLHDLIPLTLPLLIATGPALAPMGRGENSPHFNYRRSCSSRAGGRGERGPVSLA